MLVITNNKSTAYITLDIHLLKDQWNPIKGKVRNHQDEFVLNTYKDELKHKADSLIISLQFCLKVEEPYLQLATGGCVKQISSQMVNL